LELLGYITLTIFIVTMVLTLFRKINLPVQTVLVLVSLVNLLIGFIFRIASDGFTSAILLPNEMIGGIILHPITALLGGLFLAGALEATRGFDALKVFIAKLQKKPHRFGRNAGDHHQSACHRLAALRPNHCGSVVAVALFLRLGRRHGLVDQNSIGGADRFVYP